MLEVLGTNYYIDIDTAIDICRPTYPTPEETLTDTDDKPVPNNTSDAGEINIFKFEIVKACIERTLGEYEPSEEDIAAFAERKMTPSFKIAFNTLLKYEILKEDNE